MTIEQLQEAMFQELDRCWEAGEEERADAIEDAMLVIQEFINLNKEAK